MSREWKPGDVAWLNMQGHGAVGIWTGEFWAWSHGDGPFKGVSHCHRDVPARPLVVIDPEDREQVERLVEAFSSQRDWYADTKRQRSDAMQAALREFADPTPAQVYRHFVASKDGGLQRAHCGKVWRRNAEANVTVMGDCPECSAIVKAGWSA